MERGAALVTELGSEDVLVEITDGVATVMLNRPDKRNAMTPGMDRTMRDSIRALDADDEVRAIVITGAGDSFCSGMDISAGAGAFDADAQAAHDEAAGFTSDTIHEAWSLWKLPTPTICAINGHAVGAGMSFTLLFDIRYVAEDAKLSFVFPRRGLVSEANSNWLLPRMIGVTRALELLLSGRTFSGREAAEWGIAARAFPKGDVLTAAHDLARDIATNTAPASVSIIKRLVYDGLDGTDRTQSMIDETKLTWWSGQQPDAMEGVMAWLEKRDPKWTGSKHPDLPADLA
jgi:enoyl-CoA hydratase/carnithine racemase